MIRASRGAVVCALALSLAGVVAEPARSARAQEPATSVVMLGTGTPNADPERSGPAVAVVSGGQAYLVDCGPGIVRRAAAAAGETPALAPDRLDTVFITHLHSDHTVGCADLLFSPWVLEREKPLRVFGPPGTAAMFEHLSAAYKEDVAIRVKGIEPANSTGWRHEVTEIESGFVYRDENVVVTALGVYHGSWEHAFGYRFEAADRSIVISGDTAPSDALVDACDGCDVLVHEVYSTSGFARREPVWQRYHAAFHTSAAELVALATRARPRLLVLYHQLFWGTADDRLVEEVRSGYRGAVVSGRDFDVF